MPGLTGRAPGGTGEEEREGTYHHDVSVCSGRIVECRLVLDDSRGVKRREWSRFLDLTLV